MRIESSVTSISWIPSEAMRASTSAKLAVARADEIDRDALAEVSEGHRREGG